MLCGRTPCLDYLALVLGARVYSFSCLGAQWGLLHLMCMSIYSGKYHQTGVSSQAIPNVLWFLPYVFSCVMTLPVLIKMIGIWAEVNWLFRSQSWGSIPNPLSPFIPNAAFDLMSIFKTIVTTNVKKNEYFCQICTQTDKANSVNLKQQSCVLYRIVNLPENFRTFQQFFDSIEWREDAVMAERDRLK